MNEIQNLPINTILIIIDNLGGHMFNLNSSVMILNNKLTNSRSLGTGRDCISIGLNYPEIWRIYDGEYLIKSKKIKLYKK